jgi:hypothetical protein
MFERILEVLGSDASSPNRTPRSLQRHHAGHFDSLPVPTYAEHDKFVSANDSVDSATHRLNPASLAASQLCQVANDSRESKPYTNRNLMTTMRYRNVFASLIPQIP